MGAYESVLGITKYDHNRHVKVEFDSPKFHHNVGLGLEPIDTGTSVGFQMRSQPTGMVSKLIISIFSPMISRGV